MRLGIDRLQHKILIIVGSLIGYYLAARIGLELATINNQTSPVWPATGFAISLLYILGPWTCFGIFGGAFLANWLTGLHFGPSALIGLGNTLEALLAVFTFHRLVTKSSTFESHGRLVFAMLAMLTATALGATIGTVTLFMYSVVKTPDLFSNWLTWWTGDTLGALFIVPFAYKISQGDLKRFTFGKTQILKLFAILLLSFFINQLVFRTEAGEAYSFLLFLPLLVAASWFPTLLVYLVSFLICINAIINTALGFGPFVGNSVNESLIHLQLFLASLGFTAVGIGSLKNEGFHRRTAIVLLLGWGLSGLAFHFFYNQGLEKDRDYFLQTTNEAKDAVLHKLSEYANLLESGASFFDASDNVTSEDWREFTARAISSPPFRGIHGIGVVFSAKSENIEAFQREVGLEVLPKSFFIHHVPVADSQARVHFPEIHLITTFVEPKERNQKAFGLDIATEVHRYEAAKRSRDSGEPALTYPVQLVQDDVSRPGHLFFYPIYRHNSDLRTIEERRRNHRGYIYMPIVAHNFFTEILEKRPSMQLEVRLKEFTKTNKTLFVSKPLTTLAKHKITQDINLAGLKLSLAWSMGPVPGSTTALLASWLGFSGAMCSLFLAILLGNLENLTARAQKIASEKTVEAEERRQLWQALTENSPVGIYLTDAKGFFTYVNPTWSEIMGISLPDALGDGWVKAIHTEDRSAVQDLWNELFISGKFRCHYRSVKPNQTVIFVDGQAVPMRNARGVITGYVGTIQDVTDLQMKQEALIASSRLSSLGEMASGIAHEINNPLAIIIGKARWIEKLENVDTVIKTHSQQIVKTANRISKIIKGLQAFARETSNEPFEIERVADVIQNTLELCRERFTKHQTNLTVPEGVSEDLKFWGREEQLSQVVMNLLNNAFDAVQDRPDKWVRLQIESIESDAKIRISVEDSGAGVTKEDEERIFNPFFTTKEVGKGTGLGLSISKGIVEKHKGQLYLDRSANHTRFVIELPRYQEIIEKAG